MRLGIIIMEQHVLHVGQNYNITTTIKAVFFVPLEHFQTTMNLANRVQLVRFHKPGRLNALPALLTSWSIQLISVDVLHVPVEPRLEMIRTLHVNFADLEMHGEITVIAGIVRLDTNPMLTQRIVFLVLLVLILPVLEQCAVHVPVEHSRLEVQVSALPVLKTMWSIQLIQVNVLNVPEEPRLEMIQTLHVKFADLEMHGRMVIVVGIVRSGTNPMLTQRFVFLVLLVLILPVLEQCAVHVPVEHSRLEVQVSVLRVVMDDHLFLALLIVLFVEHWNILIMKRIICVLRALRTENSTGVRFNVILAQVAHF